MNEYLKSWVVNGDEKRQEIYDFIIQYREKEQISPTHREIGEAVGIASSGHVFYHLNILKEKGLITYKAKKSRSIIPVTAAK